MKLTELSGRVVLVDFWGSWCGPCLAEIPKLRRLQARFGDKAFTLLGVNSDKDPETLRRFFADNRMSWTNVFDGQTERPIARAWGVAAWPARFLVDARGVIRGQDLSFEKLEWQIGEMLKKN